MITSSNQLKKTANLKKTRPKPKSKDMLKVQTLGKDARNSQEDEMKAHMLKPKRRTHIYCKLKGIEKIDLSTANIFSGSFTFILYNIFTVTESKTHSCFTVGIYSMLPDACSNIKNLEKFFSILPMPYCHSFVEPLR